MRVVGCSCGCLARIVVCCGLSLAGLAGLCLVVGVVYGLLCGFLVLVVAAIAVLVWVLCIVLLVS